MVGANQPSGKLGVQDYVKKVWEITESKIWTTVIRGFWANRHEHKQVKH